MEPWNVLVTVHEGFYRSALEILERFGQVRRTEYFNVLVLRVADTGSSMKEFKILWDKSPGLRNSVARFVPVTHTFFYNSAEEFEKQALKTVLLLTENLGGKKFHVRMHRRGFKKRISSLEEEIFLNEVLLEALKQKGADGSISFTDPDAVIVIETVGQQAGIALFNSDELAENPFLQVD